MAILVPTKRFQLMGHILEQVEDARLTGREINIMGDFNLDFNDFNIIENIPFSTHSGKLAPLIKGFR